MFWIGFAAGFFATVLLGNLVLASIAMKLNEQGCDLWEKDTPER